MVDLFVCLPIYLQEKKSCTVHARCKTDPMERSLRSASPVLSLIGYWGKAKQ